MHRSKTGCASASHRLLYTNNKEKVIGAISHHLGTIGISLPEITFRTPKVDFDVHLYKLREMEDNPLIARMIRACDADYVAQSE